MRSKVKIAYMLSNIKFSDTSRVIKSEVSLYVPDSKIYFTSKFNIQDQRQNEKLIAK